MLQYLGTPYPSTLTLFYQMGLWHRFERLESVTRASWLPEWLPGSPDKLMWTILNYPQMIMLIKMWSPSAVCVCVCVC